MKPRLRRASPLTHHLIEAVAQTLEARPEIDRSRVGVIGAFFFGCLVYSVKFYKGLTNDGRHFASPVLFPETVANTPLSHVVSELGISGPVYSQIGDTSCWASALRAACVWLACDRCDHVIVAGGEEFEPLFLDAFDGVRWFQGHPSLRVAEGAGAVLLARHTPNALAQITHIADGFSYRTRQQAKCAATACLAEIDATTPVMDTATGWMRKTATLATEGRQVLTLRPEPCFDAFTASSAWNTILATQALQAATLPKLAVPHWGLSQQIAAVELAACPKTLCP
jgi:hypothetical protein